ncbi:MAG TPA: MarR family transcriptional regulator [Candidatus Dormibacteraeota bacterium]|nr:MarR family transcriptional regulator [Candidatus Dormibacteraeota bacterium]
MPRPDAESLAVWQAFLEAHARVLERLEREMATQRGLTLVWYEVLLHLSHAPGGRLRMRELANSVLLSRSGLSRRIDAMERAGLVRRESCPSDRRGVFAVLTERGRATLRRAAPVHLSGIHEHFGRHLDPGERAVMKAVFERLAEAADVERRRRRGRSQPLPEGPRSAPGCAPDEPHSIEDAGGRRRP